MEQSSQRSLKHEYDLYVENEIEVYKDSISRTALLKIGDEAVASLHSQTQFTLSELLLVDEVDRIIRKRLRIPSYATWRKKEIARRKELEEFRRPERWGVRPDSALAREVHPPADSRVLVAGPSAAGAALYLAAQGCSVTAISSETDGETVFTPEDAALFMGRVDNVPVSLTDWSPEEPLSAVVCTPAAFAASTWSIRSSPAETSLRCPSSKRATKAGRSPSWTMAPLHEASLLARRSPRIRVLLTHRCPKAACQFATRGAVSTRAV
jgi:hypothetical protein